LTGRLQGIGLLLWLYQDRCGNRLWLERRTFGDQNFLRALYLQKISPGGLRPAESKSWSGGSPDPLLLVSQKNGRLLIYGGQMNITGSTAWVKCSLEMWPLSPDAPWRQPLPRLPPGRWTAPICGQVCCYPPPCCQPLGRSSSYPPGLFLPLAVR